MLGLQPGVGMKSEMPLACRFSKPSSDQRRDQRVAIYSALRKSRLQFSLGEPFGMPANAGEHSDFPQRFPSAIHPAVHNGLGENDQGPGLPAAVYSGAVAGYGPLNHLRNAAPHAVHRAWRPIRIGHGNRSVQPKVRLPACR